jgi:hypothetical protein
MKPKDMLWNSPVPQRQSIPGERVWSLGKEDETLTCELRDQGEFGWEAQTFRNGEFQSGQRFDLRAQAEHYAAVLHQDFERLGWTA